MIGVGTLRAMADDAPPPAWIDLASSLALVGRWAWLERRLFEVVGGWVASTDDPAAKRLFATQCHHHAWRAEQWDALAPEPWQTLPDDLRPGPPDDLVPFVDALAVVAGTVGRLAGLHRVALPHLLSAYADHLDRASVVADAPVMRVLRLVRHDALDDWRAGEALLEALTQSDAGADEAAAVHVRLESLWPGRA